MKVAFCFKGFMRHWKTTYPHWKVIFDKYDSDVFIHTWDTEEYKDSAEIIGMGSGNVLGEKLNLDAVNNLYNPKVLVAETYSDFNERFIKESEWLEINRKDYLQKYPERYWINYNRYVPMMSVLYKWMQVSNIKQKYELENNFTYDIVFHSRTDFMIDSTFVLKQIDDVVTGPWPNTQHTQHWVDYDKGMNDLWAYGPSKKMDMLSDVYSRLDELWKFCMDNEETYGYFEAANIHTLPITNIMLHGLTTFTKINNQYGQLVR